MAVSKKRKGKISQKESPRDRYIGQTEDPNAYYQKNPVWNFAACDNEMWPLNRAKAGEDFWGKILPFLKELEKSLWKEILTQSEDKHHILSPKSLSKTAVKRLNDKHIESDTIVSLRIDGTRRIYGYITKCVFNILWYDPDHGDNDTCVCRWHTKHT